MRRDGGRINVNGMLHMPLGNNSSKVLVTIWVMTFVVILFHCWSPLMTMVFVCLKITYDDLVQG